MKIALAALALIASPPAPAKPLFDTRPATIDGIRYERERVFEGDYVKGFEVSAFDPLGPRGAPMWLQGWTGGEGAHHIRFIGRRTAKPGHYGHLGAYRHMVLITDMIDARPKL
jgi:hypothetical protein